MKDFDAKWGRLVAAARQVPAPADVTAPYGFAVRVAARAWDDHPALQAVFGRVAVRALWVACLLMVASVAAHYFSTAAGTEDADQNLIDPVSMMLTASS